MARPAISSLNPIRAEGRDTRPNSRPVATAKPSTPTNASSAATKFAEAPWAQILPYPTVVSVWELKKKRVEETPPGGRAHRRPEAGPGPGEVRDGERGCSPPGNLRTASTGSRPAQIDEVQVGMKIAPRAPAAVHVEAAIFVDDPPERDRELLGQAGIEAGCPHRYLIALDAPRMHPAAGRWFTMNICSTLRVNN